MISSDSLFDLLALSTTASEDKFEARRGPLLNPRTIYGGELMAQALIAATKTVASDRKAQCLHCYFHQASSVELPNQYQVTRLRDGKTFSHRWVSCMSNSSPETQAFQLDCSFKAAEHDPMSFTRSFPNVTMPDELPTINSFLEDAKNSERIPVHLKQIFGYLLMTVPFEIRPCHPEVTFGLTEAHNGLAQHWLRLLPSSRSDVNALFNEHREAILAYMSDLFLLGTANIKKVKTGMVASLNHTMWFHNPWVKMSIDDWILIDIKAEHLDSALALVSATMWLKDGTIIANMCQQGLMRSLREDKKTA